MSYELSDENSHVSGIRRESRSLNLVIAAAVIVSGVVTIIANLISVFLFPSETTITKFAVDTIIFIAILVFVIVVLRYIFLVRPYKSFSWQIVIPLIFHKGNSPTVIDDPFGGYFPQEMAYRILKLHQKSLFQAAELPFEPRPFHEKCQEEKGQKSILTQLLEYILLFKLSRTLSGWAVSGDEHIELVEKLPSGVEGNLFINLLQQDPSGIYKLLVPMFHVPTDVDIQCGPAIDSSVEGSTKFPRDSFKASIVGEDCEIHLTARPSHLRETAYSCYQRNQGWLIEDIPVRRDLEIEISNKLLELQTVWYSITIEAKFSGFFRLPRKRVEWAENSISGLVRGGVTQCLDFQGFKKVKLHEAR